MLKLALILLIGLINVPKITPCQTEWQQCGGIDWRGDTTCCGSLTCTQLNPWYYQCLQGATDPPTTTTTTTAPPNQGSCQNVWQQCGGINFQGSTTCCTGTVCIYLNDYYFQCQPASDPTTTVAPTTTVSTTTVPTTTVPTTTVPTTTVPTTTPAPTTTAAPTTTPAPDQNCVTQYQQCEGINYSGSKTCCAGTVCSYINEYYSQCKPTGEATQPPPPATTTSSSDTPTQPPNDNSQPGVTTRYWDCCKASCGWAGKAYVSSPVQSCQRDGVTPIDVNTQSICNGGDSSMCNNQQPWSVNSTFSFGYAAAHIAGQGESDWCCACYLLTFTSTSIAGKKLMVQVTNTGGDLGNNHFDLQMPGGGVGIFNGCASQFPGTSSSSWGAQYGGISNRDQCANLPTVLQPGCYWRFDWFQNADNPNMVFKRVDCPTELTDNTHCRRL